jgi:hypothetical protein
MSERKETDFVLDILEAIQRIKIYYDYEHRSASLH